MRTTFHIRQPYADIFFKCARNSRCTGSARPDRFIQKMKYNRGILNELVGLEPEADGLERKNPLIVALGDSVTAGHFESLMPDDHEAALRWFADAEKKKRNGEIPEPLEITDARESYVEKFRNMLIDQFEETSVSAINSGIAGDDLISMSARAERDVIRYQPDLILINGSLNWSRERGATAYYKELLRALVQRCKRETMADIILLTPNGHLPDRRMEAFGITVEEPTTHERAEAIRQVAEEEGVCLADVFAVWEAAREAGCPWEELLANKSNHPAIEGHEVYAMVLMKLFEE